MNTHDSTSSRKVRTILLQLAKSQEDQAATEAAETPYWAPHPEAVIGHRAAAAVLRREAERLAATA